MSTSKADMAAFLEVARNGDEAALRDAKVPWPESEADLLAILKAFKERQHDYGTCVYAMSMSALAAYYLVSHWLGVTGFQASCADIDILRRTRDLQYGKIMDYGKLLYPQYLTSEHFPSIDSLMADPKISSWLSTEAGKKLEESPDAHPDVIAHWSRLAALPRSAS